MIINYHFYLLSSKEIFLISDVRHVEEPGNPIDQANNEDHPVILKPQNENVRN